MRLAAVGLLTVPETVLDASGPAVNVNGNSTVLFAAGAVVPLKYFGKDLVLFHEYFCGDTSRGVGASHQTGWTALAVRFLEDLARARASTDRGAAAERAPARRKPSRRSDAEVEIRQAGN